MSVYLYEFPNLSRGFHIITHSFLEIPVTISNFYLTVFVLSSLFLEFRVREGSNDVIVMTSEAGAYGGERGSKIAY